MFIILIGVYIYPTTTTTTFTTATPPPPPPTTTITATLQLTYYLLPTTATTLVIGPVVPVRRWPQSPPSTRTSMSPGSTLTGPHSTTDS